MAKLNIFFGIVALLLATSVTTLKIGLTLATNQDTECKHKVGKECGKMIVSDMFFQNVTTNDECCKTVVKMGKKCHDELVGKLSTQSPFQAIASQAHVRSKKIWDKCASISNKEKEIEQCKHKVSKKCGVMIVNEMFFNNATTSDTCCKAVANMGKHCHEQLVKKFSTLPPFQANASKALSRSKKLWHRCASTHVN